MNSYERVMRRLEGKPVDKIPNLNIVMFFAAQQINVPFGEFCTDYRRLVEGNIKCCEDFGIDVVTVMSDPVRETHSFGADIIIPEDGVPYSRQPLIQSYDSLSSLKPTDPFDDERMLDRIRAVELYKDTVKGKYPIIGWVEGALAEAADLRGVTEIMTDLLIEPDRVFELLEIIYIQQKKFAKAQIDAGADIIGVGDAVASLIGPVLYEKFALPYEKRIIKDIHDMGAKVKLHICGNIKPLLKMIRQTEADIVDIDWMVDFNYAVQELRNSSSSACGNMNPVSVFLQGNQETVKKEVSDCISCCIDNTFIAAGCEIPKNTPVDNLLTMDQLLYIK